MMNPYKNFRDWRDIPVEDISFPELAHIRLREHHIKTLGDLDKVIDEGTVRDIIGTPMTTSMVVKMFRRVQNEFRETTGIEV